MSAVIRRFHNTMPVLAAVLVFGCARTLEPPKPPPAPPAAPLAKHAPAPAPPAVVPAREPPPPSGPTRVFRFPQVQSGELPNGLKVATLEAGATPLLHIRMVVLGGSAADGTRPGLAALTAQLIKDGGAASMKNRELIARIESLGATLRIGTASDYIAIEITSTNEQLEEALRLLAAMVTRPMFSAVEFGKTKTRAVDRLDELARTSRTWMTEMVLYRDLFDLPAERHPYSSWNANPAELSAITLADCRGYHRRMFVPQNSFIVVAGAVKHADIMAAAGKSFSGYRGAEPPAISFTDPVPPESLKITLIDQPGSTDSEVTIGVLGPARADDDFPSFAVAGEVLGESIAGRLDLDSQQAQPVDAGAGVRIVELARGPSLLIARASVKAERTGPAVKALLEQMKRLESTVPEDDDVSAASRVLVDGFAVRMSSPAELASELVRLRVLGLPDDDPASHRKQLQDVTAASVGKAAGEYIRSDHAVVVVAADANAVGPSLSRLGQVKVVDATKGFARVRTILQ